ncbi:MAG: hypothetical protein KatS3mg105_3200 [Gemmatales bacterium]|nr:MAG: hypothetical protein KatS3mg105_3200 [Gemmatales bacterium]
MRFVLFCAIGALGLISCRTIAEEKVSFAGERAHPRSGDDALTQTLELAPSDESARVSPAHFYFRHGFYFSPYAFYGYRAYHFHPYLYRPYFFLPRYYAFYHRPYFYSPFDYWPSGYWYYYYFAIGDDGRAVVEPLPYEKPFGEKETWQLAVFGSQPPSTDSERSASTNSSFASDR